MVEAAEAGKSIRKAHRSFSNYKVEAIALRRPDGTVTANRKAVEKIIHKYHSFRFDSDVHPSSYEIKDDGYVVPPVLFFGIEHDISSVKNRTASCLDRIISEHLKNLPPVLVNSLARFFTRYLSESNVASHLKTSKVVLLFKKGDLREVGNYRPVCLLSVLYKLIARVILNKTDRTLSDEHPCGQEGFLKGFSTMDHIHTITKLIEEPRECK